MTLSDDPMQLGLKARNSVGKKELKNNDGGWISCADTQYGILCSLHG
jgi:hypothetical protein